MERIYTQYLVEWIHRKDRKPLLLRGARQVGKSYLIRDFAQKNGHFLMEINLENTPELGSIICERNPTIRNQMLETHFNISLQAIKPLLFLDELQAVPEVIARLRYFYEQSPELPVIGAGSLLDFTLSEHDFSMPVGRIETVFMGPLTFEEFLLALGEKNLLSFIQNYQLKEVFPEIFHSRLMDVLRMYYLVGGMPEAVSSFIEAKSYISVDRILKNLLIVYQDDFNKYRKQVSIDNLRKVFRAIPGKVGKKLVYSQIDPDERSAALAKALNLLRLARVIYPVQHTSGNGIPLGSEASSKYTKVLFLDVGLMNSSLGLSLSDFTKEADFTLVHEGSISEQFIGQNLLLSRPFYEEPELYMWAREKAGSMAEVDYLISKGTRIIPIEVKAGKSGKLKSLQVFISEKNLNFGVRLSSQIPSLQKTHVSIPGREAFSFDLLSLPLYMVGQIRRLIV